MKFFKFDTPSGGKGIVALDAVLSILEEKSVIPSGGSQIMLRNNEVVTTSPGVDSWATALKKSFDLPEGETVEVKR